MIEPSILVAVLCVTKANWIDSDVMNTISPYQISYVINKSFLWILTLLLCVVKISHVYSSL